MGNCRSAPVDYDAAPNLFHFELSRPIGKGAFGQVRVVRHKKTKQMYALKYVKKKQCVQQKAMRNIIQERRMLEEVDHPFIVNMRYAFQDDENLFFVLDLMLGGDLRFHLERSHGALPEKHVRFWMAELTSAVEYLHRMRIMHRDIKPDNIMLDQEGHAHLTDLNVSIHFSSTRMHTSIGGSMAYMAPEMLAERPSASTRSGTKPVGYTWCVDWWSLGATAYELLHGCRPFEAKSSDGMKDAILNDHIKWQPVPGRASGVISREARSFVQGLLTRDPAQRLGCRPEGQGLEDIHAHPWFAGIDWARLDTKQLPPAFAPDKNQPNFDVGYELDEFLLLEQPLHHKKRKNVDPEALTPEYRQLEEEFGVYDARTSQRMAHVVPEPAGGRASHSPSPSRADGGALRLAPRPSGASSRSGGSSDRAPSRAAADDASSATAVSTDRRSASPTGSHLTRAMREDFSRAGTPVTVPVDPHLHMRPAPLPPARRSGSSRPSR